MDYRGITLRNYLDNEIADSRWREGVEILYGISSGLNRVHRSGFVHGNLHGGNVLVNDRRDVFVLGFGLLSDIETTDPNDPNALYGVLPYIAPEILNGGAHTEKSDVYSFGIIMTEMTTGKPPFYDRPHDENLAKQICEGLRPEINRNVTPRIYFELAKRCLDSDPTKRPTFEELETTLQFWFAVLDGFGGFDGEKAPIAAGIRESFRVVDNPIVVPSYQLHKGASYVTSKLNFGKIHSPPRNREDHYTFHSH